MIKKNQHRKFAKAILTDWTSILVLTTAVVLSTAITIVVYNYTKDLLIERLRERISAVAATAAVQFTAEDVLAIRTPDDTSKPEYIRIVQKLRKIQLTNEDLTFVYLMRRTNDPDMLEFVADSYALEPFEELDANENGVLDDDEIVPLPGDPYPLEEEYVVLRNEAFDHAAAEHEVSTDQWATLLAGYAPIKDEAGNTVAIIGLDVEVEDYLNLTQATLLPFLLLVFFFIALICLLTVVLIRSWNEKVEAVKELDRQKDELLSIVSHQLATPISSIKWYLEMMRDGDMGKLTKEQEENVESLQYSALNLTDLVSMILDVSRIQLGRMKVDRTDLDTGKFFKEVAKALNAKATEKNITFEQNIPEDLPVAMLDMRLMRMTLENLLSNAIKYTPKKGKVTLNVEVKDNKLFYEVKDSGCGIPKKEQKQIFGKLFRASNVGKVDGNGFGLYVAKGALEAQGGKVSFESTEGKGTIFKVILPLIPVTKKKRSSKKKD